MTITAYDPNSTLQQNFLQALALGETGNSSFASTEGVGGSNLARDPTDAYGFPVWAGMGNSHAAGTYQFEPNTWDELAGTYGLNFANPQDQSAGAWLYAQQTYAQATGGGDLTSSLARGDYQSVQRALSGVWPSVQGNAAEPSGLAGTLAASSSGGSSSILGNIVGTLGSIAGIGPSGTAIDAGSSASSGTGWFAAIENWFLRGGLILVGGVLVVVALWVLIARSGAIPSPGEAAKAVAAAV